MKMIVAKNIGFYSGVKGNKKAPKGAFLLASKLRSPF